KDIAYSYDTYYFNSEKGAVYDYSVRPNGLNEGTVVTKPFKIVHKNNLEYYHVNLGGNWLNNYNADDFNPMSLSKGKVTYANNVLKLENAEFSTPYVPLDEVYGLFVQENSFLIYLKGTNSITGTDEDSYYGLYLGEDEKAASTRQWCINGLDNNASLSLMGDLYCQSLNEESKAQLSIVDSKITVTDAAYCWQEDYVDLFIRNSELDLSCAKWSDQTIMESFNSVTLQDCQFADGCYWDAQTGMVMDSSGQPATGQVRIQRSGSTWKKGDVTGEGDVNSADVVAIYRYIIEGEASGFAKIKADVDGNGDVNSADVVAVYKIIISGN
ncbi:MAG: dockerin type I repeat-containing protein, partial [Bacteroidales bacterium]|nr:dockerin type I repeat-containing protein [Bacteroidales bacterium]